MKIISWNINGIRTLPQYHPWNTLKTCDAILHELGADITCFQEMKITRNQMTRDIAAPEDYDAFFSLPTSKGGYSGVAVYTKASTIVPHKAEEGLCATVDSKLKPQFTSEERVSPYSGYPRAHELQLIVDSQGTTPSDLVNLDSEGRALVLDFGRFVLVNTYCPNEGSEERLPFKMNYHFILQERVRKLLLEGRHVIVVGDINVCAAPIDHVEGNLGKNLAEFGDHPARAWFSKWIGPDGPMVDVIRMRWPQRKGMFTCWNTKISARESNYGTRIDYILVTRGLLPWIKHGDILPELKGSDHCPIFVELHDDIELTPGQSSTIFESGKTAIAPRLCAKFWPEFSPSQKLLSTFFTSKSDQGGVALARLPKEMRRSPDCAQEDPSTSFVSEHRVQCSNDTPTSSSISSITIHASESQELKPAKRKRGPTSENVQSGLGLQVLKKSRKGQSKLGNFFGSSSASSHPKEKSKKHSPPLPQKFDPQNGDEAVNELDLDLDLEYAIRLSKEIALEGPSNLGKADSKGLWSQMFAPVEAPRCIVHDEPCKELTTTKQGPNKGKKFWICARPLGPGYDAGKSKRARQDVDPQYRCDFFKWSSDVKKSALSSLQK